MKIMRFMRYLLLLITSLTVISTFAAESTPELSKSQGIEWTSKDTNSPFRYEVAKSEPSKPTTISGEVSKDSAVSARVDCVAENGVLIRFLIYKGGTFVCRNVKAIVITSTGSNDSAKGLFTVKQE